MAITTTGNFIATAASTPLTDSTASASTGATAIMHVQSRKGKAAKGLPENGSQTDLTSSTSGHTSDAGFSIAASTASLDGAAPTLGHNVRTITIRGSANSPALTAISTSDYTAPLGHSASAASARCTEKAAIILETGNSGPAPSASTSKLITNVYGIGLGIGKRCTDTFI